MSRPNAVPFWAKALLNEMKNPESRILSSDKVVVILDKFPKARHHYLVLPFEDISTIFQLKKSHLSLLDEMFLLGQNTIEVTGNRMDNFSLGFHLSPSMNRVHMHVISTDFDSPCLKTKAHWNSFNTEFFILAENLRNQLETNGFISEPSPDYVKQLLKKDLKCNHCEYSPKTMPDLKSHIKTHGLQNRN